jgi:hypothetical protein
MIITYILIILLKMSKSYSIINNIDDSIIYFLNLRLIYIIKHLGGNNNEKTEINKIYS